jgi:hypothetical protein
VANDIIGEVLDLMPLDNRGDRMPTTYEPVVSPDKQAETDIDFVRKNMYDLIEKGTQSMDELLAIADQSQHPRSYEVLSGLIKNLSELNKDLLDLHDKKKKLLNIQPTNTTPSTVNNNLFVGSTSDLLKMINQENNDKHKTD